MRIARFCVLPNGPRRMELPMAIRHPARAFIIYQLRTWMAQLTETFCQANSRWAGSYLNSAIPASSWESPSGNWKKPGTIASFMPARRCFVDKVIRYVHPCPLAYLFYRANGVRRSHFTASLFSCGATFAGLFHGGVYSVAQAGSSGAWAANRPPNGCIVATRTWWLVVTAGLPPHRCAGRQRTHVFSWRAYF